MVSGSLSLPSRGSFHLSLTVLVHYRSPGSIQPFGMVPDTSGWIRRAPPYSGSLLMPLHDFGYGSFTLFASPSQVIPLSCHVHFLAGPITPPSRWFGLLRFRSPLLTESIFFLLLQVLRSFSSLRLASYEISILSWISELDFRWVPPFGHRRFSACLPLPDAFRRSLRPSSPPGA